MSTAGGHNAGDRPRVSVRSAGWVKFKSAQTFNAFQRSLKDAKHLQVLLEGKSLQLQLDEPLSMLLEGVAQLRHGRYAFRLLHARPWRRARQVFDVESMAAWQSRRDACGPGRFPGATV